MAHRITRTPTDARPCQRPARSQPAATDLACLAGITDRWLLLSEGLEASVRDSCLAFAFGWAENMIGAALKAMPLGQNAGQRMLARLATDIPEAVAYALALDDDHVQAFTPMLAVLSARDETQYSRLFRS